eukprot:11220059-Lingulodinium_polyedra.AAC.1
MEFRAHVHGLAWVGVDARGFAWVRMDASDDVNGFARLHVDVYGRVRKRRNVWQTMNVNRTQY